MSLSTIIAAAFALICFGGGLYGWGLLRNKKQQWEAEAAAETSKKEADHAKKVATIFAKPAGSKSDIIDRL